MERTAMPVLKLPYLFWNYILQVASYILFWVATLNLVFTGLTRDLTYKDAVWVSASLYAAGFLCFLTGRSLTKHGYRTLKKRISIWAQQKYGVTFSKQELQSLITPKYSHQTGNRFHSQSVNQWYEVDNGRKEKATFSIIVVSGTPILYREEISGEFQTAEERLRQHIIAEFAEEVGGNKVVYVYSENGELEPNPNLNEPVLLWSDSLRVDLYMGHNEKHDSVKPVFAVPVDVFFEQWVPTAIAQGTKVGINWNDNDILFDTNKIFVS